MNQFILDSERRSSCRDGPKLEISSSIPIDHSVTPTRTGYVLKFYCPIREKRIRRNTGTRDRRTARRVMRECQERLISGQYATSGGAITAEQELATAMSVRATSDLETPDSIPWDVAYDRYRENRSKRVRPKSLTDALSRIQMAERIFSAQREEKGLPIDFTVQEVMTLSQLEYLQDRLLAGDEGRYDYRSPNSVNSIMGAIMAFVNFCHRRGWIETTPFVQKLDADDAMRGRPITAEEFQLMLDSTPIVVGKDCADSWRFVLQLIWESGFRIGDVMDFSWLDERHIRPVWPNESSSLATVSIPSTQKNGRTQIVPMMPGLRGLLESVPIERRSGWIANPQPIQRIPLNHSYSVRPTSEDLKMLAGRYSNRAIGRVFGVTDTTVRCWLFREGISLDSTANRVNGEVPGELADEIRSRGDVPKRKSPGASISRLSKDRVSRVISMIGETAGVVVVQEDPRSKKRRKYASAHDIRRGFAQRLINSGVSAETLKVVMRHRNFATTEKHYGAIRSAQAAATEVQQKLATSDDSKSLVGGLMGGNENAQPLNGAERELLKSLLEKL